MSDTPPNKTLQATPVGACLVVLTRRSGVPELFRSAAWTRLIGWGSFRMARASRRRIKDCSQKPALQDSERGMFRMDHRADCPSRGEPDQSGTDGSIRSPDPFSVEARHGFDFREDPMRYSEAKTPNKSLQATPVGASLEVLRHESGVPELGR